MCMSSELLNLMDNLKITQIEAAKYLSVDIRTIRRWVAGNIFTPKAALHTLRAWIKLRDLGLPWVPGSIDIIPGAEDEIKKIIANHINQHKE